MPYVLETNLFVTRYKTKYDAGIRHNYKLFIVYSI